MGFEMGDTSVPGEVHRHYERLADTYDDNWAYNPDYLWWMAARIAEALEIEPSDRIADIGCGTGLFAREVANLVNPQLPLQCVDPSAAMLKQLDPSEGLWPIQASAEDLAQRRVQLPHAPLDAAWMKEAVHHVADKGATLAGLAEQLAPGGRLLIVMLPATIEYPLFSEALKRYEALQPNPADIAQHLTSAGLRTSLTYVEHQLTLNTERYLAMVRARYMSLLSLFSDAEIEAGIEEIRRRHPEPELSFPDRFAFVLGRREESVSPSVPSEVPGSGP
ncbi:class I SAM-dependent methyltransferase [Streptomyces sp. 7N604]|uniref:class I SAM-dependent methyltransferase n=1 Tax=Streptomyces sp. 7N604 TaxID=3457415 RepID=UPI003FD020AC